MGKDGRVDRQVESAATEGQGRRCKTESLRITSNQRPGRNGSRPAVGVRAGECEGAVANFRQCTGCRSGGPGQCQIVCRDIESGGCAGVDREVAIAAGRGAGVLQGAAIKDQIGRGIGRLPQVTRHSPVADRPHT